MGQEWKITSSNLLLRSLFITYSQRTTGRLDRNKGYNTSISAYDSFREHAGRYRAYIVSEKICICICRRRMQVRCTNHSTWRVTYGSVVHYLQDMSRLHCPGRTIWKYREKILVFMDLTVEYFANNCSILGFLFLCLEFSCPFCRDSNTSKWRYDVVKMPIYNWILCHMKLFPNWVLGNNLIQTINFAELEIWDYSIWHKPV